MGNYVAGALAQATVAGILSFIVLSILGVPFAAPLALIIFFLDLIPLVGATIGAASSAGHAVQDFPTATIVWVVFSIVYQQVENNVIQPQIQRTAVSINPFLVIVAVLFGSSLLGIIGALVAVPVAASIQIAVREYMDYRGIRPRPAGVRAAATGPCRPRTAGPDRRRPSLSARAAMGCENRGAPVSDLVAAPDARAGVRAAAVGLQTTAARGAAGGSASAVDRVLAGVQRLAARGRCTGGGQDAAGWSCSAEASAAASAAHSGS